MCDGIAATCHQVNAVRHKGLVCLRGRCRDHPGGRDAWLTRSRGEHITEETRCTSVHCKRKNRLGESTEATSFGLDGSTRISCRSRLPFVSPADNCWSRRLFLPSASCVPMSPRRPADSQGTGTARVPLILN